MPLSVFVPRSAFLYKWTFMLHMRLLRDAHQQLLSSIKIFQGKKMYNERHAEMDLFWFFFCIPNAM
jgi:hypothetical protein